MQSSMLKHITEDFGNGGTIDGDLTISGDLTVSGGGSLSFDEIIEGTQVIDVTSTEALLVRKNGDGGEIFTVDTTNSAVEVGGHLTLPDASGSGGVLKLGASEDIQIYHDGSNSYLDHLNTGDLKIRSLKHGGDIVFHTEASDGTQSASALVVSSTGSVGIGASTSPLSKLHIKGSSTGAVQAFIHNSNGATNSSTELVFGNWSGAIPTGTGNPGPQAKISAININASSANSVLAFSTYNSSGALNEVMRITDTQKVGIGTSSTSGKLTIANGVASAPLTITASNSYIQLGSGDYGSGGLGKFMIGFGYTDTLTNTHSPAYIGFEETSTAGDTKGDLTFYTRNVVTDTAPTERLRIDEIGNMGLGMTPSSRLSIKANGDTSTVLDIHGRSSDDYAIISFKENASQTVKGQIKVDGSDSMIFRTGPSTDALTITSGNTATFAGAIISGGVIHVPTGHPIYLDGGSNTYIYESTADTMSFVTNSGIRFALDNNSRISLSNKSGSGTNNTLFGYLSGNDIASGGNYNSFYGHLSGTEITTGEKNTMLGAFAGYTSLLPDKCVLVGYNAGGSGVMTAAADGTVAVGMNALSNLTSGANNLAIGFEALDACNTGASNIAVGSGALGALTDAVANVAMGLGALGTNVSGNYNTAFGHQALQTFNADVDANNVAVGINALQASNTGTNNTVVGAFSGDAVTSQSNLVLIGSDAGGAINNNAADGTVAIGRSALASLTSGTKSTAVGFEALKANTIGHENTAFGYNALMTNVDGDSNTAIGGDSLKIYEPADGVGQNTALGFQSGDALVTGSANTLIGFRADTDDNAGVNQTVIGSTAQGQADNSVTLGNADVTAVYMAQDSGATVHCAGIKFDASGEVLGDYEEGEHTTAITGATSGSWVLDSAQNKLSYTKIGRMVTVVGKFETDSGSGAGSLRISLPFTSANLTSGAGIAIGSITINRYGSTSIATQITPIIFEGTNYINVQYHNTDGTSNEGYVQANDIDAIFEGQLSITYFTD